MNNTKGVKMRKIAVSINENIMSNFTTEIYLLFLNNILKVEQKNMKKKK